MPLDCKPPQPEPVAAAIERLFADPAPGVDPWWAAGLAESLGSWDGPAPQETWGGAGVVEP
jgi:hypothetical protein